MADGTPVLSQRERNKQRVREALITAADELFAEQGYEETTADAIAERAGVSRRTFFRYFASKEAIAFPRAGDRIEAFGELLRAQLVHHRPLAAVREAGLTVAREMMKDPSLELARQAVVDSAPSLIAAELEVFRQWEQTITDAITPRRASARRRRRAMIFSAATVGVLRTVLREWYDADGRKNLVALGREAFEVLERGFDDLEMK